MNPNLMNGSNLAYIGDAYYELRVREYLLSLGITKNKELRKISIGYVSANAHQIIYNKLATELNEEENQIFLRGRNIWFSSSFNSDAPHGYRKNVDKKAYATSTGLEAVIGYLYLTKNMERLNYLVSKMFAIVEEEKNEHIR